MLKNAELERLTVLAKDLVQLYTRFLHRFDRPNEATIEEFGKIFDESRVEFLHYSGSTTLDQPFFPSITDDLLTLSSAYLSIPATATAARGVHTFGLLLSFFMYSTQPARQKPGEEAEEDECGSCIQLSSPPSASSLQLDRTNHSSRLRGSAMTLSASPEETSAPSEGAQTLGSTSASAPKALPLLPSLCLPMRPIPVSLGCMQLLLSRITVEVADGSAGAAAEISPPSLSTTPTTVSSAPLSYTEAKIVLALHRARAWHVQPYLQQRNHILALLAAHEACAVPLVRLTSSLPPATFAATLTARSMRSSTSPLDSAGGTDSLFRDPEFMLLRSEYEAARSHLLSN